MNQTNIFLVVVCIWLNMIVNENVPEIIINDTKFLQRDAVHPRY